MNEQELLELLQDSGYIGMSLQAYNKLLPLQAQSWSQAQNEYLTRWNQGGKAQLIQLANEVNKMAVKAGMRPYAYANDKVTPSIDSYAGAKDQINHILGQIKEAREFLGNRGKEINAQKNIVRSPALSTDVPVTPELQYREAINEMAYLHKNIGREKQLSYLKAMGLPQLPTEGKLKNLNYDHVKDERDPAGQLALSYVRMNNMNQEVKSAKSGSGILKQLVPSFVSKNTTADFGMIDMATALISGDKLDVAITRAQIQKFDNIIDDYNRDSDAKLYGQIVEANTKAQLAQAGNALSPSATDALDAARSAQPAPVTNPSAAPSAPISTGKQSNTAAPSPVAAVSGTAPVADPSTAGPASMNQPPATEARKTQVADAAKAAFNGSQPTADQMTPMPPNPNAAAFTVTPSDPLEPLPQSLPTIAENTPTPKAPAADPYGIQQMIEQTNKLADAYEKGKINRNINTGASMLADTVNAVNAGLRLNGPMPEYRLTPQLLEAHAVAKRYMEEGMPDIAKSILQGEIKRQLDADTNLVKQVSGGSGGAVLANRSQGIQTYYEGLGKIEEMDATARAKAMPMFIATTDKIEDQTRKIFEDRLETERKTRESAANLLSESMTRLNNTAQFQSEYGPGSMSDIYQWSNIMMMRREAELNRGSNEAYMKAQDDWQKKKEDAGTVMLSTPETGRQTNLYPVAATSNQTEAK